MPANGGIWNYNFNGVNFNEETIKYGLAMDYPKEFYHELHRTQHFLDFVRGTDQEEGLEAEDDGNVDMDDNFN